MEWISVIEREPLDEKEEVLGWGPCGAFVGVYCSSTQSWALGRFCQCDVKEDFEPVTHWMPLPWPPAT